MPACMPCQGWTDCCSYFSCSPPCVRVCSGCQVGVLDVLEAVVDRLPSPVASGSLRDAAGPFLGRVVDSWFDEHRGVVCLIQAVGGTLTEGQRITTFASVRESKDIDSRSDFSVQEIGILTPTPLRTSSLRTGQVQCVTWRGVCGE